MALRRPAVLALISAALLAGSTASCARVPAHRSLPQMGVGEASFIPTVEAYTTGPVIGGNALTILLNGDQIFPARLEAIRAARKTITFAQYFYEDGPIAREIAEALAERCRAGVRTHVLLDAFGALKMPAEYRALMEQAGCQVVMFRPPNPFAFTKFNNRSHRRILVVDGRVGFTGGSGVSAKWMGNGRTEGRWRDTDVRVEGPVVEHLQSAFAEHWMEATGHLLGGEDYFRASPDQEGTILAQVVSSSPVNGRFAMYTLFLLAMSSARQSILITSPYFLPNDRMIEALTDAAKRGVRVVVLVPARSDSAIVRQASRLEFGNLLEAGIQIYEYRAALLHAKTMVIDGTWATIGSTNMDNRSFALNDEVNLVAYDKGVATHLEKIFQDDLAYSKRIEYAEWRRRLPIDWLLKIFSFPAREQF